MPRYVTTKVAAERLHVHPNTIRNWANAGVIRVDRLPSGFRRILESEVERLERELSPEEYVFDDD